MTSHSAQRGGTLARVLLGIAIILMVGIGGLALTALFLARSIQVTATENGKGKTLRVETPVGSMNLRAGEGLDPKTIGVPLYPGAERDRPGQSTDIDLDFGGDQHGLSIHAGKFFTSDSEDQVVQYYRERLPNWRVHNKRPRRGVVMESNDRGYKRIVTIQREGGRTRIALASIGEPASN